MARFFNKTRIYGVSPFLFQATGDESNASPRNKSKTPTGRKLAGENEARIQEEAENQPAAVAGFVWIVVKCLGSGQESQGAVSSQPTAVASTKATASTEAAEAEALWARMQKRVEHAEASKEKYKSKLSSVKSKLEATRGEF